jgi:hypothetical protein
MSRPLNCRAVTAIFLGFTIAGLQVISAEQIFAADERSAQQTQTGFFHRHPKLKKYLIMGGIGAATGGVGAAFMGKSVAAGATTGVGTHIAEHEAAQKYKDNKGQKHTKTTKAEVVPKKKVNQ